jgi:hypothetical protein
VTMPTSAEGTGLGELRRLGIRKPANRPGMIRKTRGAERIFWTDILQAPLARYLFSCARLPVQKITRLGVPFVAKVVKIA